MCRIKRCAQIGTVVTTVALALTACGGQGDVDESLELYGHTVEYNAELAERVPDEWANGVTVPLQVLRPNAFVDEDGEALGMQPDMLRAISTKLGIPIDMEVAPFDAQVPGVQSGQYAFTTGTGDFPERQEVLTMVDYTIAGLGWLTTQESDIESLADVCGATIGVAKGTNQEVKVEEVIAECETEGIPGTEAIGFSNTLMTVPLEADRIDVTFDSISSVLYFAEFESDAFRMVSEPVLDAPIAFGVVAGEDEKAELLREAVQELMDEGVYDAIFEEWALNDLKLEAAYINSDGLSIG